MLKDLRAIVFIGIVLVTTLGVAGACAQATKEQTPPPRPPWVDADGRVKLDAAPREVPAVGVDGKSVKDAKGDNKMVPSHIGAVPPPPLR